MKKLINIQLNQDILKIIALLTMTLDHIGYILTPSFETSLRLIGRISFPIFVFLLVFNLNQKDLFKKYLTRLIIFAIITSLALGPLKYILKNLLPLNIFWSLLLGTTAIYIIKKINTDLKNNKSRFIIIAYILSICATLSILTDYEIYGFLYILNFYYWFKTKNKIFAIITLTLSFFVNLHISIPASIISCLTTFILLLPKSRSKKTKRFLKPWWLFYAYYPIHLAILYIIRIYF